MFQPFRGIIEALKTVAASNYDLAQQIVNLRTEMQESGPAAERVEALELSRVRFESEIEGLLLKAEGKLKAANNAEARERQLKKHNDRFTDPLAPESEEAEPDHGTFVLADHAEPSEEEKLQAMRLVVADDDKTPALKTKWGMQ